MVPADFKLIPNAPPLDEVATTERNAALKSISCGKLIVQWRERLLTGIRNLIDTRFAGQITMTYLSLLTLARPKA